MKTICIFFFIALSNNFLLTSDAEKTIATEGIGINCIVTIGESKNEIKRRFGKSDKFLITKYKGHSYTDEKAYKTNRKTIEKYGKSKSVYFYSALQLYIGFDNDDLVNRVYFTSDRYQTKRGLKVGESREKAYSIYGQGDSCQTILRVQNEGVEIYFNRCNEVEKILIFKAY